jgi:hypothetical protein
LGQTAIRLAAVGFNSPPFGLQWLALTRNIWSVLRIVVLLLWIGFAIQQFAGYFAQAELQIIPVQRTFEPDFGPGQYRISGGLLDYAHTVGVHETEPGDDGGSQGLTYRSYVPYLEPTTGRVAILMQINDRGASPSALRQSSQAPLPRQIEGTVSGYGCDDEVVQLFKESGMTVSRDTPVLLQFGQPTSWAVTLFFVFMAGIIPILLFAVRYDQLQSNRPVNLD